MECSLPEGVSGIVKTWKVSDHLRDTVQNNSAMLKIWSISAVLLTLCSISASSCWKFYKLGGLLTNTSGRAHQAELAELSPSCVTSVHDPVHSAPGIKSLRASPSPDTLPPWYTMCLLSGGNGVLQSVEHWILNILSVKAGMRALFTSKGESMRRVAICFENQGHFHMPCATELLFVVSLTPGHSGLWECTSHQMHVTSSLYMSSQYCRVKTWP